MRVGFDEVLIICPPEAWFALPRLLFTLLMLPAPARATLVSAALVDALAHASSLSLVWDDAVSLGEDRDQRKWVLA